MEGGGERGEAMATFKCAMCRGTFEKGQSDEAALSELAKNFGGFKPDECDLVCNDCYAKIDPVSHPWVEELVAEERSRRI